MRLIQPYYFNPRQIGGLVAWFDATDPSANGIQPSDGTSLSTWIDKSPQGNNATQGTGANQPVFNINQMNGKPAINFNGTTQLLTLNNLCANSFTVFVAVETTVAGGGGAAFQGNQVVSSDLGGSANDCIPVTIGGGVVKMGVGQSGGGYTTLAGSVAVNTGNPVLINTTRNSTSGQIIIYVNNTLDNSTTTFTGSLSSSAISAIGAQPQAGGSSFYSPSIGEILIYSSVLSSTARNLVARYFSHRWGMTIA